MVINFNPIKSRHSLDQFQLKKMSFLPGEKVTIINNLAEHVGLNENDKYQAMSIVKHDVTKFGAEADKLLKMCLEAECSKCGEILCRYGDPLHFHHDGCPTCHIYEND